MIFIILPILAIIGAIIYDLFEWGRIDGETILKCIMFALVALLLALAIWAVASACGLDVAISDTSTCEISALADNARYSGKVSGSVFLVQSRVDEKLKYSYMFMEAGKGYGFKEVAASSCYINYTDGNPYVVINQYDYANGFLRWLFPNPYGAEYIFYIPEGAQVIDDFTIDFN